MRNEVIPKFTARFGIAVEFIAGRSSQIVSRVETERAAGILQRRCFSRRARHHGQRLYSDKMIDPLKPLLVMPEVADGSKWKTGKVWFVDPQEQFVVRPFSSVATLLFINTDHVKPDEMRTYKDLLNPKWRGKISTEDPTTTGAGANMAARLYTQIGEEFVKQLYIDQKTDCHPGAAADVGLAGARHPADLSQLPGRRRAAAWLKMDSRFSKFSSSPACRERSMVRRGYCHWPTKRRTPKPPRFSPTGFSSKEGLETYAKRLRLGDVAHGYQRIVSQPGQFPKKGVKYFDDTDWKWIVTGRHESREKVWKLLKARK